MGVSRVRLALAAVVNPPAGAVPVPAEPTVDTIAHAVADCGPTVAARVLLCLAKLVHVDAGAVDARSALLEAAERLVLEPKARLCLDGTIVSVSAPGVLELSTIVFSVERLLKGQVRSNAIYGTIRVTLVDLEVGGISLSVAIRAIRDSVVPWLLDDKESE